MRIICPIQSALLRSGITVLDFGLLWDVELQIELRIEAIQIHVPSVLSAETPLEREASSSWRRSLRVLESWRAELYSPPATVQLQSAG